MTIEFRAPDRSGPDDLVMAELDGEPIGRLDATTTDLTVPGGFRVTAATITGYSVHEEHRRQGVLTGMMELALTRAQQAGEVVACITSPETAIHGRFGFGVATDRCSVEIDACSARPVHRPAEGVVEPLSSSNPHEELPEIYEQFARQRAGTIGRSPETWRNRLGGCGNDGAAGSSIAVHRDSTGLADGYIHYDADVASPIGTVHELWGATIEVERALWAHLLTIDGVARWRGHRPADDPIRFAVADIRSVRLGTRLDELWLRLLDVDVALGTREYRASAHALTLRVIDPVISSNTGTFRIDAYGSFRSQGDPDLELGIESLSALYLGGTTFHDLHGAGRIRERRSGAVSDADDLFVGRRLPYCGSCT